MVIHGYFGRFKNFSMKWLTFRKIKNKAPLFGVGTKKNIYGDYSYQTRNGHDRKATVE